MIFKSTIIHTFYEAKDDTAWQYVGGTSAKLLKAWAIKHSYNFALHRKRMLPNLVHAWDKIPILIDSIKNNKEEWHAIFDADMFITNTELSLDKQLGDYCKKTKSGELPFMYTGSDWKYPINAGFLLVNKRALSLLEALNRLHGASPWGCYEQGCLQVFREASEEISELICPVAQPLFNSYSPNLQELWNGTWSKGDFLVHYAGWRAEQILNWFGDKIGEFEYLSPEQLQKNIIETIQDMRNIINAKKEKS